MPRKYYAIRKGVKTGIFYKWDECKKYVLGYPGAEYKSFLTEEEAVNFLGKENSRKASNIEEKPNNELEKTIEDIVEIYVDGSYCPATKEFSYGMLVLQNGQELPFSKKVEVPELASMHNVAGEIKGAEAAMQYALDHSIPKIRIYHDYEGIAKWCTGAWKTNKPGTIAYKAFYDSVKEKVTVEFVKVKGHSNDKYNDIVDSLAKAALGI